MRKAHEWATSTATEIKIVKIRTGPSGIHFFDRNTGANLLIDEIVPEESMWAEAPRQVSIALTNACDLACPYCFAPKAREALAFEKLVLWLCELDDNGTLGVGFGGGEPTLYRRFAELCTYAAQHTRLAVTFTTHGHHLGDGLLSSLEGHVHFIRVSMDGVGATYERLRGRSFDTLVDRLGGIKRVAPFGVNYVVNADTFPHIDAAAQIAEATGASDFLLLPEHPVNGRGGITRQTAEDLKSWVRAYSGKLRLAVSALARDGFPTCDPLPHEMGLRAFAHIDAQGVLKLSSHAQRGVSVDSEGVMRAIRNLRKLECN